MIGSKVNRYTILEKLGSGGMGEVYLAEDTKLDRKVALKFLPEAYSSDPEFRARFEHEAKAAASLDHQNIVTVYEIGEHQGKLFIAMQYVQGATLQDLILENKLSLDRALEIAHQLCDGLIVAHSAGIIHRDLKPANILVTREGIAKIADFGLAKSDKTRVESKIGSVVGTLQYNSPEQCRAETVDKRSDIFSLGVIIYEMITLHLPFTGEYEAAVVYSIAHETPEPLARYKANLPNDLQKVVSKCLEKETEHRFQSVQEVRQALDEARNKPADSSAPRSEVTAAQTTAVLLRRRFTLNANLVRQLDNPLPQMIGSHITYIDNNRDSDTLVIYLHGLVTDHRRFTDLLRDLPCHGIAFDLYGWSHDAKLRPALSLADHSILMRGFFKDLRSQFPDQRIVLAGFSSGADHICKMVASTAGAGIDIAGVLSFGCSIDLSCCFFTSRFAQFVPGDEQAIIQFISKLGENSQSLSDFLLVQKYAVEAFSKFEAEVGALKQYCLDLLAPFENGSSDEFTRWYQGVMAKYPASRFAFSLDEYPALDKTLSRHLKEYALGPDYSEESIIREPVSHLELTDPELMLRHTLELIKKLDYSRSAN